MRAVRSKLPPTPVRRNKSTPKSCVTPHSPLTRVHSKVQSLESYSCALFFPLDAKAYLNFDPNNAPETQESTYVQNRTHDPVRAPETPCRLAYFVTLSPCSCGRGAARSAPKARAVMPRKPRSESGMDPLRSSIKHLRGEVGVGGFPILQGERRGWMGLCRAEYEAALR